MTLTRSSGKASGSGDWQLNEKLKSAQMNHIEDELVKAIDGYGGGTYSPKSTLTFDGEQVIFDGDGVRMNGNLEIAGASEVVFGGSLTWSGTLYPLLEERSLTFTQPLIATGVNSFEVPLPYSSLKYRQTSLSDPYLGIVCTRLPTFGTLTGAFLRLDGNTHSDLPANMPTFTLYARSSITGTFSSIGTVTDGSNLATYQVPHSISINLDYEITNPNQEILVVISGESGSNADINLLEILGVALTFDVTKVGV